MILSYPNKILLTPSVAATPREAKEIDKLLRVEAKVLTWGKVVGLAAPQIGINKKVFFAMDKTYVNPVIVFFHKDTFIAEEGCYSLTSNKFNYKVLRHKTIKMRWEDLEGVEHMGLFQGFHAQILQHEYDHFLGKLCIDE